MTIFSLKVCSASLHSGIAVEGFPTLSRWYLSLKCVLDDDTLEMSDGVQNRDITFTMNFMPGTESHTKWLREKDGFEEAIGAAHYFAPGEDGGARVFFEAHAPRAEMDMLLAFAQEGSFPMSVSVSVDSNAVTYGRAPDGSEKRWDASIRLVPVTDVHFHIPISKEEPELDYVEPEKPRTPVGLDLVPILRKIAERQGWFLIGLLALASVLLLKH